MSCNCLVPDMCAINSGCIINHPLFEGYRISVAKKIRECSYGRARERMVIDLLQLFQPPKVNGKQIGRYYNLLRQGLDIDKEQDPNPHTQKIRGVKPARKKRNKMLNELKTDKHIQQKNRKRATKRFISEQVKKSGIEFNQLTREEKGVIYSKANFQAWIENWKNQPEPNFHEQ